MGIWELFVLALGLSMDAFAVSVCKGLSLGKVRIKHMLIAGAWFGGFQALMPLLGYFLGDIFAGEVTRYGHWLSFILLSFIGIGMIREAFDKEEETDASMTAKSMLLLAVATSIDAFAVGVTFAFLRVNIAAAVSFIGVVTFVCSALGIRIGSIFGARYRSRSELCGGIILIAIGIKILLSGIGVL